jgi:NAD(P)H-dependent FMN reductase
MPKMEAGREAMAWSYPIAARHESPAGTGGVDNSQPWRFAAVMAGSAPSLAIVWHSRTGAAETMARAAYEAAGADTRLLPAAEVRPDDLLAAAGYLFVCPENLGSMSGMMKEMFDRCYYPLLGRVEGRPYATAIAAGSDGRGAQAQLDRIVTGWRLRRVAEPLIVNLGAQTPEAILAPKRLTADSLDRCRELGAALAEGLRLGVF